MTAAVIAASTSIIVAVLVFILNQRAQKQHEHRQERLARVNSQLRELYGPLNALVDVNERTWEALREDIVPPRAERRPEAGTQEWRRWRDHVLTPVNRQMRDLIVEHADLLIEVELPKPLSDFCAHVAALEVVQAAEAEGSKEAALIKHPGSAYVSYVRDAYAVLKKEQRSLLVRLY